MRSQRLAVLLSAIAGAALPAACSRQTVAETRGGATGGASAASAAEANAAARALADPTAFDLVSSQQGALLGWIAAQPPMLHVVQLDAQGSRRTERTWKLPGPARDLALADTAAGASAVWREAGETAAARGVWLGPDQTRALELGSVWSAAPAGRGNLALVSRGESALAIVRGPRESCEDGSDESCFGFRFHALSPAGATQTGLGLRVPVPCDEHAAQLVAPLPAKTEQQRWHYAVCTRSEHAPVLTVFSIEPDRSYASARQVFAGCAPLGAGYFAGQAAFFAECRGVPQVARSSDADEPFQIERFDVRGLVCGPHGARVRLGAGWLALDQPLDHLELLLDSALTPPGARAVWTGSALLVAHAGSELTLERYACRGGELRQLSSSLE